MSKPLSENANVLNASFDLSRIDTWIFDIDNTLYPAECDLFTQIHAKMAQFVGQTLGIELEEAMAVRRKYFLQYGTTMRGMMEEHGVDPNDYMHFVHDVDYSPIKKDEVLRRTLQSLPGRKLVFTNASVEHGRRCAECLGVDDLFDGWFDIRDAQFEPKPHISAYDAFIKKFDVKPEGAIFFEDTLKNLDTAKQLGWQTAYIGFEGEVAKAQADGTPPPFAQVGYVDAHGAGLHAFFGAHCTQD